MIVIRAIGSLFAKLWGWIKRTAWVQPLLIVGLIFAVIFSIPAIVNGINNINSDANAANNYYHKFQKSLVNNSKSEADKLVDEIYDISNGANKTSSFGEKFFVLFVDEACENCKEAKGGFEVLESKFTSSLAPNDGLPFKMYTIFADEVTSDTTTKESAFQQFLSRHLEFFEFAGGVGYDTAYYNNDKITDSQLEKFESADPEEFSTPSILLIDYTDSLANQHVGVSEIMFGITGDNDYKKAELLRDCWNHTGDFE